jgi:hypothetical protein
MATNKLTLKLTDEQQQQIREATGQAITELTFESVAKSELSEQEMDGVVGGAGQPFLAFTFKLVAVKTISWGK